MGSGTYRKCGCGAETDNFNYCVKMLTIKSAIFLSMMADLELSLSYHPLECSPLASERNLFQFLDLAECGIGLLFDQLHCLLYRNAVGSSAAVGGRSERGFFDGAQ